MKTSFISLLLGGLALTCAIFSFIMQPNIALIDNNRLIREFAGTIEAEKRMELSQQDRRFQMDSLQMVLKSEYQKIVEPVSKLSKSKTEEQKQAFLKMRNEFSETASVLENQTAEEEQAEMQAITRQLNSYVKSFCEAQGYDYVLGANGTGNIWFVSEAEDITDAVLSFANSAYEGN